jgi:PST family polysaccharide transporter
LKPFDATGAFQPAAGGLRRLAIRGAAVAVFGQGLALTVQIVATVVLARLLAPGDFGVIAMVTTFSLLLVNFGVNGFTEAILQNEVVDHALASNLFWINLSAGILLSIGFAASGSLLARFYGDPRVAGVSVGIALTIFVTSTSVLHLALLQRAMCFTAVSANDICARVISVVVSILLALAGWGYWALVSGAVAQPLSASIGAWLLCRWVPGRPRRVAATASVMQFAMHVYGRFSVNYFARNTDNLLVGWRFNAQALGFYKKAYDLFALSASQLIGPLTAVAVSALSRLSRDATQYRRYFLSALGVMALMGMGMGADLMLVGKDVIRVLLGPGWEESGRIFVFFGPGIGMMLLYCTHGWIHLSIGRADRWFRWGILELAFTGLLFVLALPWGPVGIAVAWTASFWILTIPAFWYAGRPIQLGVGPILAVIWRYLAASLLAGCASAAILRNIPYFVTAPSAGEAIARSLMTTVLFGTLYLGVVILLHRGCAPLYRVADLLGEIVPWRRFSRSAPGVLSAARPGDEPLSP